MDLAFDRDGTLYVLEIDHDGLLGGADGAIFAIGRKGTRQIELPAGALPAPGGITVGHDGLYVSINSALARRRTGAAHPLMRTLDHPQGGLTPLRVRRGLRRMKSVVRGVISRHDPAHRFRPRRTGGHTARGRLRRLRRHQP